jgi:hypothetical protein
MSNAKPSLVKVQIAAEFVLPDGDYMTPGTFGPVEMTAREWAEFDLQAAIEAGIAESRESPSAAPPNRAARRAKPPKK